MVNSVARQVQAEREEAQSWKISVHLCQVFVLADPLGAIGRVAPLLKLVSLDWVLLYCLSEVVGI